MDEAPAHVSRIFVQEFVQRVTYTPLTNPIEDAWRAGERQRPEQDERVRAETVLHSSFFILHFYAR